MRAHRIDVPGHWFWGNIPELRADLLALYRRGHEVAGPVARLRTFPGVHWYAVYTAEGVERVLGSNARNYRAAHRLGRPMRLLAGDALAGRDGDPWRARRLVAPAVHRARLAALGGHVTSAAESVAARWRETAERVVAVDAMAEMTRLTLRVVGTAIFGRALDGEADVAGHALRVALVEVGARLQDPFIAPPPLPTARNRRFVAARRVLHAAIDDAIARRRRTGEGPNDLLGLLLEARDEETKRPLDDGAVRDEVMTLLLAAHETTAATLAWAWLRVGAHREVERRLHAEVDAVLGGRVPTVADLPSLPYVRALVEETLRLHPPAWGMARQAIEADEVCGVAIPRGAIVVAVPWVTHRLAEYWPEPDRFEPARFLPGLGYGRSRFAYYPFGVGTRLCLGRHFALMEAQLALATLAGRHRLHLAPGATLAADATLTMRPARGVPAWIEPRTPKTPDAAAPRPRVSGAQMIPQGDAGPDTAVMLAS